MMKKKNEESNIDVNECSEFSSQNLTSGSWGLILQGSLDCQSATALNTKTFRKKVQRIATWSICTLYQQGKLDNAILELNRMKINCLGFFEMRWNWQWIICKRR